MAYSNSNLNQIASKDKGDLAAPKALAEALRRINHERADCRPEDDRGLALAYAAIEGELRSQHGYRCVIRRVGEGSDARVDYTLVSISVPKALVN